MILNVLKSRSVVTISFVTATVGTVIIMKEYLNPRYAGKESLKGKVAIVTGANTGIGKEITRDLAKRGCRVIMGCRNERKCMDTRKEIILETRNSNVICRKLNLESFESIREFADHINKNELLLNILVNNAAVMNCPKSLTKDGIEMQIGVNHFGHFLLTNLLLDKLKSSSPSRIINVSSVAHTRGVMNFDDLNSDKTYKPYDAYAQSKLANVLFTRELSKILKGTNVFAYSVHPGLVNTQLMRHMSFYSSISGYIIKPFLWLILLSPKLAAHSILYCILSPEIANDTFSGKYFSRSMVTEPSDAAKDDVASKKLWLISEKWTKLK